MHRGEYQENLVEVGTQAEEKEREKVADYFASYLLMPEAEFNRAYKQLRDVRSLKQHFRVSYKTVLYRLNDLGIADYPTEQKKIYTFYKKKYGRSLGAKEELPPALDLEDFPENERFTRLVWQALFLSKITELKAAELLEMTVEKLREARQEEIAYAV
ncbi:MAG: ImmA/IrrE family metallo-endopeptidase [Leptolyngbyaceae cyanobacterium]